MGEAPKGFPHQIPFDVTQLPKLSEEQAGHLRHFHNIASAPDGDWPHMGTQDPEQAFLDAYRYQLATMVYGSSIAHYHRLPAMRGLFKPLIRGLIHKMLLPHVWNYWYLTSQSGKLLDPDITELRKPWADPVVKENIMYSGHLLLMLSLYAMLFDEDEFENDDSITFRFAPMFWGMGPETFQYSTKTLQDTILQQMEQEGWAGVCCEPNAIFVVCNQFPIIAVRLNDFRHGTKVVDDVLAKYWPAIQKRGMVSDNGLFVECLSVRRSIPIQARDIAFTAWGCAFMNSWNSEFIHSNFERQARGFITTVNGRTEIQHPSVGFEIRRLVEEEGASADSAETVRSARRNVIKPGATYAPFQKPLFGYIAQWLSELGKEKELQSLLHQFDSTCDPKWENNGLYYPRNSKVLNDEGDWTFMDPYSGNAAIGYARLNVLNGQKKMWENPWTKEILANRPYIAGIQLSAGVNCLRGEWHEEWNTMIVTLKALNADLKLDWAMENLAEGWWGIYRGGKLVDERHVEFGNRLEMETALCATEEVDIVIMKEPK